MAPEQPPARPWALADADYDVVIVGGGMAGAGAARDLALRGLSVALVDKGDFASATTARSSKLIHGGLRYLELWDFGLVRESLAERERLRRLAPHLVRPLPFLVPIYRESSRGLIKVRIGLTLYDWLTPGRDRERYRVLRAVDALSLEPGIRPEELRGAGYYFDDLLLYPERLCLENVLSACRHGARAFNYAQVEEVRREGAGGLTGVRVRDLLTGGVATLRARIVVNATGPWVDELRALARVQDRGAHILRRTKGIHCLLPRLSERAIYHSTQDDRMIFVIPWREFSLVGTTDTDFDGDLDRVHATRAEVDYLLGEVRHAVPDPRVAAGEVLYTYAGVRPLSFEEGRRASDVSRTHKVIEEAGGRFLSITGTKLTCFRSLAEALGDRIGRALGRAAPGRTARLTLDGADEEAGRVEAHTWLDVSGDVAASGLPRETLETLVSLYGRNYRRVMELAGKVPGGAERLCPSNPDVVAQLHHAVQDELTVSL
ncbi:MAG TPA: glycerol-3-phosphate dehydrogenase/oxidase, partial [Methylomirabilota bacterium]|nr:glycerol-3-phosphate dehydrogenase/oxidase [Methylomirabilota bacterium]